MKQQKFRKEPHATPQYDSIKEVDPATLKYFDKFPLSKPILSALKTNGFTKPTEIQRLALKHALLGCDIVVEAATGSGKTLSFLIPVLEKLFVERVTTFDGPVAVILTPTRELARQICLVLKRFCANFKFTILDIMGGKNSASKRLEWSAVSGANILIGTPGRLAQHMTENPILDMSNLRILVLDEADRLLDSTFRGDMDTIMTNINPERQTMLFSATQTNTIAQLTRLHMRDPVVMSTRQLSTGHMPGKLVQSYAVVPLERKLDTLWVFLQSHCRKKIIVFFSTQKQVRYTYELFQKLRPYFRVMEMRGNMLQLKRFKVYDRFAGTPTGCVLLATNVAERDFPAVDWVVQFDCPRELDDYVHRVGRTARIGNAGRAITFLLPSETGLLDLLRDRGVQLKEQKFSDAQVGHPVSSRAPALLAAKPELAMAARYAFNAYLNDYCLGSGAPNKQKVGISSVFNLSALPLPEFAESLGLPSLPDLPKRFSAWMSGVSTSPDSVKQLNTASWGPTPKASEFSDRSGIECDENDEFLRRKPQYVSALGHLNQQNPSQKLLDLVESSSNSSNSDTETKSTKKTFDQATKVDITSSKKPVVKTIGGVPVPPTEDFDRKDGQSTKAKTFPDSTKRLDVELEKQYLREVVDKKDRELWKLHRKEQNRLKRKKLKEARLKLQQARGGATLPTLDDERINSDAEEETEDDNSDGNALCASGGSNLDLQDAENCVPKKRLKI
ncbi:RNA helicase [Fasciolopsis buskii]|uniref:ATP-dependent RNA helicase n=1 Tax=Fasciolopsis buskii TaxID=27845 RepID=A0A8E0RUS8_9TREM|nr:RNA helicase [Fasciolopsis buski]